MKGASRYFAETYFEARDRFLEACRLRGVDVASWRNPHPGPQGQPLYTDAARIGPADARSVLVVQSGTHGVEGYAGSAIQLRWLSEGGDPPQGVAVVLVHALNPYGFAWTRRYNEDNVDLNRSFLDHSKGDYPPNPGYEELARWIIPDEWTPHSRKAAEEAFDAYAAKHGERAFMLALKMGQYDHPKGAYYGGRKETWSGATVRAIATQFLDRAERAALIDIHTGLGPFGYGDCLTTFSDVSKQGRRAIEWYGKVTCTKSESSSYSSSGCTIIEGYTNAAPHLDWTPIGLEFGTWEPKDMRDAVRADGWLHAHGLPDHPQAKRIKAALRNAFYPGDPVWRSMVIERGEEIVARGLVGLASAPKD